MNFLDKLLDAGDSYGKQAVEDTQAKLKAQLSKEDAAESSSENDIVQVASPVENPPAVITENEPPEESIEEEDLINLSDDDETLDGDLDSAVPSALSGTSHELRIQNQLLKNELESTQEQYELMKAHWQKTHNEKKKARDALLSVETKHKKKIKQLEDEWDAHLREVQSEMEEKIRKSKLEQLENIRQLELALKTKNEENRSLTMQIRNHEEDSQSQGGEVQALKDRISELEDDREEMIKQQAMLADEHSRRIHTLRKEFVDREEQIRAEAVAKESRQSELESRQNALESSSIESTNQFVKATKELQASQRENQRLLNENRFLHSDNAALKEQIDALKASEELTLRQVDDLKDQMNLKKSSIRDLKADHVSEVLELKRVISEHKARANARPKVDTSQIESLEKRLKKSNDHLLEVQHKLEKAKHGKAQFETLLQEARDQNDYYKRRIKKLENSDDIELGDLSRSSGRRRNTSLVRTEGPTSSPTLNVGINILDSVGAELTKLLRRYAIVRSGFIFYVLLLHFWVFVVIFHYAHSYH